MRSLNFAGRYSGSATRTNARAQRSALRPCKLVSSEVSFAQFNCGIKSVFEVLEHFSAMITAFFLLLLRTIKRVIAFWMAESLWKTRKVEEESSVVEQPQKIVPFGNERHFFLEFHSY